MQSSLSWIEWLDRLDRVLNGAREDVRALASFDDPQALAVVERCKRQLTALTDDLRLLDRRVLSPSPAPQTRTARVICRRRSTRRCFTGDCRAGAGSGFAQRA